MNICATCTKVKTLPTCTDSLTIGTVTATGDVAVYFKDVTLDHIVSYPNITPVGGVVTINGFNDPEKAENHSYEVWITDQDADLEDKLTITIGATEVDCLTARFQHVYTTDLAAIPYATQSMEVCE